MGINPVKFGKDVIDQFGRYLRNTFPIADEEIAGCQKGFMVIHIKQRKMTFYGQKQK